MIVNEKTAYDQSDQPVSRKHVIGVDEMDTWDMYTLIADVNVVMLKKFRECHHGYPGTLEDNCYAPHPVIQWDNIIDRMIEAFELLADDELMNNYTGVQEAKIEIGLALYIKWFRHLWW